MLPSVVVLSVVHWVKSMAGSDQQIDSPVGAAAVGGALGQEHGQV
jgi:hypothetical protein